MKAVRVLTTLALTGALCTVGGTPTWAAGRPFVQQADRVLGSCGTDDDLIASFWTRESSRPSAHDERLHLTTGGTITRTGTGVVGRYAEVQMDVFGDDGTERYVGALSRLTVSGSGGFTLAGKAQLAADGAFTFTTGLTALVEEDWVTMVCSALS